MPNLYQASVRNLHTITSCYRSGLPYPCSFYNDHIIYYLLTGRGAGEPYHSNTQRPEDSPQESVLSFCLMDPGG